MRKPKTFATIRPFTVLRSPATWRWCGCSWSIRQGGSWEELWIDRDGVNTRKGVLPAAARPRRWLSAGEIERRSLGRCRVPGSALRDSVSQARSWGVLAVCPFIGVCIYELLFIVACSRPSPRTNLLRGGRAKLSVSADVLSLQFPTKSVESHEPLDIPSVSINLHPF